MKNKKAYTLIEMLVVLMIMGIILVIVVPNVYKILVSNRRQKLDQLSSIAEEAAKLYAISYQGELKDADLASGVPGVINTGTCWNIPYSSLVEEGFIEEEPDVKCKGSVIVTKRDVGGFSYDSFLECEDKKGNKIPDPEKNEKLPPIPVGCLGFGGNFDVKYNLYQDSERSDPYAELVNEEKNWKQRVYASYSSESPYGHEINRYQYSRDLLNWVDITGDTNDYTNHDGIVRVRAIDNGGNTSTEREFIIHADSEGPNFSVMSPQYEINSDNQVKLSIKDVTDDKVGVDLTDAIYSFDNGSTWVTDTEKYISTNASYAIQVKDKLGNVTKQPVQIVLACDNAANATKEDILVGKKAWVNGKLIDGVMPNNSSTQVQNILPSSFTTNNYSGTFALNIPYGYQDGKTTYRVNLTNLSAGNIKYNVSIGETNGFVRGTFGEGGTATARDMMISYVGYVNGKKVVGEIMPQSSTQWIPSKTDQKISAGLYLAGNQTIRGLSVTQLKPSDVKKGVTVTVGDAEHPDSLLKVTGTAETPISPWIGSEYVTEDVYYSSTTYRPSELNLNLNYTGKYVITLIFGSVGGNLEYTIGNFSTIKAINNGGSFTRIAPGTYVLDLKGPSTITINTTNGGPSTDDFNGSQGKYYLYKIVE